MLRSRSDRKQRALTIQRKRVEEGKTITVIAKELRCHPDTVKRQLSWAERQGVFSEARDLVLTRHLAKSLQVFDQVLDGAVDQPGQRRYNAARDVLFGTAVLQREAKSPLQEGATDALQAYRMQRLAARQEAKETDHDSVE